MSKYFSVGEMAHSDTAIKKGINNVIPKEYQQNVLNLMSKLLDPVREAWGGPIRINSGYRCPELNTIVGGVCNSDHMRGCAADITAGSKQKNKELFNLIQGLGLTFDQLINEKQYTWIHISLRPRGNRGQIIV